VKDGSDVQAWRKQKRQELIEQRQLVTPAAREPASAAVNASIEKICILPANAVLAFCWPYEGEIDVRFAIRTLRDRGIVAALPAVAAKNEPLEFRAWWPGVEMKAGALGIPVPQHTERVTPAAALVPVVGFDEQGYRLGYGGGYFDRTLARRAVKPITIGVGFELSRLPTIYPQPFDIAMDMIVTERGIFAVRGGALEHTAEDAAALLVRRWAGERGLW
jgi:5,10-methenyltetrahydrofolate synthetase